MEYVSYEEAKKAMEAGYLMAARGGSYDYYAMEEGRLVGVHSCDDESFPVEDADELHNTKWYAVKGLDGTPLPHKQGKRSW